MTKYRFNKISSIRTFAESPAKWFRVEGLREAKVPRSELERLEYLELVRLIKRGQVMAIQRLP